MSRYIPVEPEKWGEMVKALSEVKRLQAENERLRKAGDAMALNVYVPIQYEIYLKLISDWEAAKQGKQP